MTAQTVFKCCVEAIQKGVLIKRESRRDKEFHFQNWFRNRLQETGLNFDVGEEIYLISLSLIQPEGYEVKVGSSAERLPSMVIVSYL